MGFSQSCVCTIFILINNLHMLHELPFALKNFVACRYNIQFTNFFSFQFIYHVKHMQFVTLQSQAVSFSDQSFLQISGKDCLVKLEIWSVMIDDQT